MMIDIQPVKAEYFDLGTHVELCAQRYQDVTQRLARIEKQIVALILIGCIIVGRDMAEFVVRMLRLWAG